MAKKKKKKDLSINKDTIHSDLAKMVQEGRARKAVILARVILKMDNFHEAQLPLIIEAYSMRLKELYRGGHTKETNSMYSSLIQNHPGWPQLFSMEVRLLANCLQLQKELQHNDDYLPTYVQTTLIDPSILTSLGSNLPLCQEARLITQAAELIENAEDQKALDLLLGITRRSPFINWRLFLQAQSAFYQGDDKLLQQNSQRISADSPLKKMADTLEKMTSKENLLSESSLLCTATRQDETRNLVIAIDTAYQQENFTSMMLKLKTLLLFLFKNKRHVLAMEICYHLLHKTEKNHPDNFQSIFNKLMVLTPNMDNHLMLSAQRQDEPTSAAFSYYETLESTQGLSRLDKALLMTEAAKKIVANPQARAFYSDEYDINQAATSCKEAAALYPQLPELYETWLKVEDKLDENREALEAQYKAYPQRNDVLSKLVHQHLDKNNITKADTLLQTLAQRAGKSHEYKVLYRRLIFGKMLHAYQQKNTKALDELHSLLTPGEAFYDCITLLMRWHLCDDRPKKINLGKELTALGHPSLVKYCAEKLNNELKFNRLPKTIKDELSYNPSAVIKSYVAIYEIPEAKYMIEQASSDSFLLESLNASEVSDELLLHFCQALCHSQVDRDIQFLSFLFKASGNLLRRKGKAEIHGLIYRSLLYKFSQEDSYSYNQDQIICLSRDLFCSAFYLAEKSNISLQELFDKIAFQLDFIDYREFAVKIKKTKLNKLLKIEKIRKTYDSIESQEKGLQLNHKISSISQPPFDPFDDFNPFDGPLDDFENDDTSSGQTQAPNINKIFNELNQLENNPDQGLDSNLKLLEVIYETSHKIGLPKKEIRRIKKHIDELKEELGQKEAKKKIEKKAVSHPPKTKQSPLGNPLQLNLPFGDDF